jgi:predicted metal-dependent phosphoesterase TrpH
LKADLHLHTTASDGRLKPQELVNLALKVGLDVIAITDHDSIDGISPAIAAARAHHSLTVVPGVELSTDVPRGEVHLLGYFIDYTDTNLVNSLGRLRNSRQDRALRIIAKLSDLGMVIQWQRVLQLAQGGSVGRPHIAQALLEAGYVTSVKLITGARGLPVLAHPADIDNLDTLIPELIKAGLIGMEVYYAKYSTEVIKRLINIAERYHLITTGGTDYHHFEDGIEPMIGEIPIPSRSIKQLFSLASKQNLELVNNPPSD